MGKARSSGDQTASIDRILAAAGELLIQRGGYDFSIEDVAKRARVSTALVHSHLRVGRAKGITTKELLLRRISATFFTRTKDLLKIILLSQPPGASPLAKLIAVHRSMVTAVEMIPIFAQVVMRNAGSIDLSEVELRPLNEIIKQVESLIAEAIAKGEIVSPEGGAVTIRVVLMGIDQTLLRWLYAGSSNVVSRHLIIETEWFRGLRSYCTKPGAEALDRLLTAGGPTPPRS